MNVTRVDEEGLGLVNSINMYVQKIKENKVFQGVKIIVGWFLIR
jgi:hypothetical protein